jgi:hypothetical protein
MKRRRSGAADDVASGEAVSRLRAEAAARVLPHGCPSAGEGPDFAWLIRATGMAAGVRLATISFFHDSPVGSPIIFDTARILAIDHDLES